MLNRAIGVAMGSSLLFERETVAEAKTRATEGYNGGCCHVRSEEERNDCGAAPMWRRWVCVGLGGEDDRKKAGGTMEVG
ncbi:hypothetical protein Peur_062284 [Populus x canadensis]